MAGRNPYFVLASWRKLIKIDTKNKYRNQPVTVDGIKFPSKKEALRYQQLLTAERLGLITDLRVHPVWKIEVNGVFICNYTADFSYKDTKTGKIHVEDVKGYRTREYRRVKKLMKAVHGIEIEEITEGGKKTVFGYLLPSQ